MASGHLRDCGNWDREEGSAVVSKPRSTSCLAANASCGRNWKAVPAVRRKSLACSMIRAINGQRDTAKNTLS